MGEAFCLVVNRAYPPSTEPAIILCDIPTVVNCQLLAGSDVPSCLNRSANFLGSASYVMLAGLS